MEIERARQDLIDEGCGFFVIRALYSEDEVDEYRSLCERFMGQGLRIHRRIMTDTMRDYIHPRSHDQEERTARIYQYFHNHRADRIGRFFDRAIKIRNDIEEHWLTDPLYRKERESLLDYVIVTQYYGNKGVLAKHRDYDGPAPLPLIQFWVPLAEPGKDYKNGNLVLYSKDGRKRRVETDLGIRKGDALIFDKCLPHEVELTEVSGAGALGRWTVLIGARAHRDSPLEAWRSRLVYGPPLYPALAAGARVLKRLRRA